MKGAGAYDADTGSGQGIRRQVGGTMLFDIILLQGRHESLALHLAFGHKVVQDIGGMVQVLFDLNFTAFTTEPFDFDIFGSTNSGRLVPYFQFDNTSHAEGPRKWYVMSSNAQSKIFLPARCALFKLSRPEISEDRLEAALGQLLERTGGVLVAQQALGRHHDQRHA